MVTKNLNLALLKLKTDLKPAVKDSDNTHFRSKYADLNAHLDEVEPLAAKHGLVLDQSITPLITENSVLHRVASTLTHVESGESKSSTLVLGSYPDMQKLGSAITYARRYTLSALLAMKAEDDDGNAEASKGKPASKSVKPKTGGSVAEDF